MEARRWLDPPQVPDIRAQEGLVILAVVPPRVRLTDIPRDPGIPPVVLLDIRQGLDIPPVIPGRAPRGIQLVPGIPQVDLLVTQQGPDIRLATRKEAVPRVIPRGPVIQVPPAIPTRA